MVLRVKGLEGGFQVLGRGFQLLHKLKELVV